MCSRKAKMSPVSNPHQQRVTHAAVTENKRLGVVLAHTKEQQEKTAPPPKVKPVRAKNGYKKTGRACQDDRRRWKLIMSVGVRNEPPKADKCQFSQYSQLMKRYFQKNGTWQY